MVKNMNMNDLLSNQTLNQTKIRYICVHLYSLFTMVENIKIAGKMREIKGRGRDTWIDACS